MVNVLCLDSWDFVSNDMRVILGLSHFDFLPNAKMTFLNVKYGMAWGKELTSQSLRIVWDSGNTVLSCFWKGDMNCEDLNSSQLKMRLFFFSFKKVRKQAGHGSTRL